MNPVKTHPFSLSVPACVLLLVIAGCTWEREERGKLDLGVAPADNPLANSAAYRNTIGSLTYVQGLRPMRVRGYGLVVGLGRNGSADCPRSVREQLVQSLYKKLDLSSDVVGRRNITPELLIDDVDTAVVVVQADIPPGAVKGTRFDVGVMALPGTRTKSLRGGRLYTADLELFQTAEVGVQMSGRVLAQAHGPIFMNPFADEDQATPLEGIILGGGIATEDRRIRLVLLEPSYHWARQIQERINSFVPGSRAVADATSPSFVQLRVPSRYADEPGHFLSLVRSLYVSRDPQFAAVRARELAAEMMQPNALHGQIALCFEGLGRSALPVLNELYTHSKDYVSFHAAVAGSRLGDHLAVDALVMHAEKNGGSFRRQAIRALADARGMAVAGMCLRRLLDDEDPRIQVAAYESLLKRGDPVIESKAIGGDNFILDRVPTGRPGFVYARRSQERRIALFGDGLRCNPPVLYRAPDGSLTISASPDADKLTLLRMVVSSGSVSPPVPAPLELDKLITVLGNQADVDYDQKVIGLGLDYAGIVRALYHLCENGVVRAQFILEQPDVAQLFGPPRLEGRPESEL
jgi:hypothetical protein